MEALLWKLTQRYQLPGTPFHIAAISVAGRGTTIYVQGLGIQIDAGVAHEYFVPGLKVFITHSHLDHIRGLSSVLIEADSMAGSDPKNKPTVYLPKPASKRIQDSVASIMRATKFTDTPKIMKHINYVDVDLYKRYDMILARKRWSVSTIKCFHTVPSTGYGFSEWRHKLKAEYIPIKDNREELSALKKSGVEISEEVEYPSFCVMGDTDDYVFYLDNGTKKPKNSSDADTREYNPDVFKYKVIIVECTYISDDEIKKAKDDKHMHWRDLEKVIKDHPDHHFILIHFSQRYTANDLEKFFASVPHKNITPIIPKLLDKPYEEHCGGCCCGSHKGSETSDIVIEDDISKMSLITDDKSPKTAACGGAGTLDPKSSTITE